jgi:wobble nucleotide-excising tRNase
MRNVNQHLSSKQQNMITKISLNGVASYKKKVQLETDKKVNLIYGLNGTGKSTFSNFLYDSKNSKFKDCSIEGVDSDTSVIVYNQRFIHDNFFEPENLKGIFTLSKENKDAEIKINEAEAKIKKIVEDKIARDKEFEIATKELASKHEAAKEKIWEIKKNYTGGDRVIEFCLEGYKSDGYKLLGFIESLIKPNEPPEKTITELKQEVQDLSGENAQLYDLLEEINFDSFYVEIEPTFEMQIVGNSNSSVSELIDKLGSSDWVKAGLRYLKYPENANSECPFCQEITISKELVESIKEYFDEAYEANISRIKEYLEDYIELMRMIPEKSLFENHPKIGILRKDFELAYNALLKLANENKRLIEEKIKFPSLPIKLTKSQDALEELNTIIRKVNAITKEHNQKIENRAHSLEQIKKMFWKIMRWDYDQTLAAFATDKQKTSSDIDKINKSIASLNLDFSIQQSNIGILLKTKINHRR